MAKRKIIKIDEVKCTGCGLCIPNCPEGALQVIGGKARLVGDLFCDGLGACIGYCPEGAIIVEERETEPYDERKVMENIIKQGDDVIQAHLEHLREHKQEEYLNQAIDFLKKKNLEVPLTEPAASLGCPGSRNVEITVGRSRLSHWPVQLMLVPANAPYLNGADLLIAADCVPFAYAGFHDNLLEDKILLVGCPKLDDADFYRERITKILENNDIKTITVANMEVPCCFGLQKLVEDALKISGKKTPLKQIVVNIKGEIT